MTAIPNALGRSALLIALALPGTQAYSATAAPTAPAAVAAASAKQPIGHEAYAGWRSIQGTQLSADGRFAAYALVAQEADGELVLRRLADGQEWRQPRGSSPSFSADGRYLAFAVQPTRAELDKAKKDKKKAEDQPKPGLGLMDTATGALTLVERVRRFAWPKDGGSHLALLLEPPKEAAKTGRKDSAEPNKDADDQVAPAPGEPEAEGAALLKKKEAGTELMLIDATSGQRQSIKDVADFQWARHGAWLAFSVAVKDSANAEDKAREGLYLLKPAEGGAPQLLLGGSGSYRQLQIDEAGRQLAFVSNRDALAAAKTEDKAGEKTAEKGAERSAGKSADKAEERKPAQPFKLYHWREGQPVAIALADAQTPGMPAGWAPSEFGALSFSKDGQRLFLGSAPLPRPEPKDAPEPLKVDLWHWKDPLLQSTQKVRAEREKQRSYRAVVHLGETPRFVQLATLERPDLVVNDNPRFALGLSELPYQPLQSWDGRYQDAYLVDLDSGAARLLARKLRVPPKLSPAGRYVLGYLPEQKAWTAWRSADGQAIPLTARLKGQARFDNIERDTPEPAEPYGVAGWTADDEAVVLYEQFDLWAVQPASGAARNLSQGYGRRHGLMLRVQNLDAEPSEAKPLPAETLMLAATQHITRATGFYRLSTAGGTPQRLIQDDKTIGGLIKARHADTLLFTQQSFIDFPNLWLTTLDFAAPQRISDANPQQARYLWGTQELIEYTAANGRKLRALLAKPENFDPRRQYPLMVYIYEKMSDMRHRYVAPAPSQNINVSRYVSQGYLVLRPDIVYTTGHPGRSAMQTVLPAIRRVQAMGIVDAKRIGIQGHSWGAYEINYLITQTDLFAAAEAGASMANMISGYGGIRWGTGISRAFQYEKGQSRMGAAPWERPDLYVENSPIFQVHKVRTPYLTIHNDEDDAVPWYQAIEFFTALRQLGKEAYWFNYNGAKHGLRDREQQKHFTVHMAEFFDHYLKGAPRPEWMDQPVPYLERGKRDVAPLFKPAAQL